MTDSHGVLVQGYERCHRRPLSRLRMDGKIAIDQPEPLLHADEPQAAFVEGLVKLEPVPAIFDQESDAVRAARQRNSNLIGICSVLPDVAQAFLRDTV